MSTTHDDLGCTLLDSTESLSKASERLTVTTADVIDSNSLISSGDNSSLAGRTLTQSISKHSTSQQHNDSNVQGSSYNTTSDDTDGHAVNKLEDPLMSGAKTTTKSSVNSDSMSKSNESLKKQTG